MILLKKHIKQHYIEAQQKKEKNSEKFFLLHFAGTEYAKIIFPLSGSSQTFMFLRLLPRDVLIHLVWGVAQEFVYLKILVDRNTLGAVLS